MEVWFNSCRLSICYDVKVKITEKLSNRFLVAGIGAVIASVLIGTFALFSVYGKAGSPSCGIGGGYLYSYYCS